MAGLHNSHNDCNWESRHGEASSPQQRADTGEKSAGQSWFADEQRTAFRENPSLGSCYVPAVGGSYSQAVTLESSYGSSEETGDWWPPALKEEEDSALEELQAIASALEGTGYTQVPDNYTTREKPHNPEVEAQDIPRMKLMF